ncbi:hypothetical protein LZZ90_10755 [Flavobacterium sp. SM15]|uniref:hypothetical protein n=1 Tax=Flavobacterium sp. SM15 TaxID=2908005 RepID=UPI001EDC6A06|nr:hypothetical protein [Flavobacterium sp. SM15]MCG2611986.1 hypothetical protein [Flavobacterium sp. SM15]
MTQKKIENLTDQELLQQQKNAKLSTIINAAIMGLFIGVAIYSTIKKGFGFFTVFPLIFAYLLLQNKKKIKATEEELKSRNLNEKSSKI